MVIGGTGPSAVEEATSRFPNTTKAFLSMQAGERALGSVIELERRWIALNSGREQPDPFSYVATAAELPQVTPDCCYDVVIAGGSLGLITALALARRGLRVMVFDRDRVGAAHREWNISERELDSLVRWRLFSNDDLASIVAARYDSGLISFDSGGTGVPACPLITSGVLDMSLDAQALLDLARKRFTQCGGIILEGRTFRRLHMARHGPVTSVFELSGPRGTEFYRARLAIDTMGSVSPVAIGLNAGLPFDGVCPTAGTVVEGITLEPGMGDVLVSVAPAMDGRQYIWEAFPGKGDETTIYIFYYDRTGESEAPKQSLLELFERYFALLPAYKPPSGKVRHLRPVFGYIPARHGRAGRTVARGLLCLGDSAAGQSPLTFCGFGSFVRHIGRVSSLVHFALRNELLEERYLGLISPHQANLRVAWVLSRFMQPWPGSGLAAVNAIMNHFTHAMQDVGPRATVRFLQDRFSLGDFVRIMLATARHYPQVLGLTACLLGARGLASWAGDMAYFAANEALRALYQLTGKRAWVRLERRVDPALALRLKAMRTGWEALM